jgi:hypothetical protein
VPALVLAAVGFLTVVDARARDAAQVPDGAADVAQVVREDDGVSEGLPQEDDGRGEVRDDDGHDDSDERKKWDGPGEGAPEAGTREVPWLHFVNLYTSDALPVFGETTSLESFRRLTRCRATGKSTEMDPALPKIVLAAAEKLKGTVIEVISGFRSEKFNEQLRKKGHEVASESYHRRGMALDWRIQGVPQPRLIAYLRRTNRGGLGTYRQSNFVHTDTGPKREWRGR